MHVRIISFGLFLIVMPAILSLCGGCQNLRRGVELNPGNHLREHIDPASKLLDLNDVADERIVCVETARSVAASGHVREAILLYEKAEKLSPREPAFDRELAALYAQAGNYEMAVSRYRKLKLDKNDVDTINNLAWTLMEAEQYEAALAETKKGLAFDPDHVRLASTQACIHYRLGDRQTAYEIFHKHLGESAAHHNLAILDVDAGNEQSARKQIRQAMDTSSEPRSITREFDSLMANQPSL